MMNPLPEAQPTPLESESVDTLGRCVDILKTLERAQRKRVADYLWAWTREPVLIPRPLSDD